MFAMTIADLVATRLKKDFARPRMFTSGALQQSDKTISDCLRSEWSLERFDQGKMS
jgi:hypothetical protein